MSERAKESENIWLDFKKIQKTKNGINAGKREYEKD